LSQAHAEVREAGGDIVAVFQYRAAPTRNFCAKRDVPFDCLGDPEREGYAAVDLDKGSLKEYLGPQLLKGIASAAKRGHMLGSPDGGDVSQRPGTFVVDAGGKVAFAHYNGDSSDNPPNEDVLEAVHRAAGTERPAPR